MPKRLADEVAREPAGDDVLADAVRVFDKLAPSDRQRRKARRVFVFIEIVGHSKLVIDKHTELTRELNGIVRNSEHFRRVRLQKAHSLGCRRAEWRSFIPVAPKHQSNVHWNGVTKPSGKNQSAYGNS